MEVYSVPWRNSTEIQWDKSTCTRVITPSAPSGPTGPTGPTGPSGPCPGCSQGSEVDQTIVAFALGELNYGDCQKININVDNFEKQVEYI